MLLLQRFSALIRSRVRRNACIYYRLIDIIDNSRFESDDTTARMVDHYLRPWPGIGTAIKNT